MNLMNPNPLAAGKTEVINVRLPEGSVARIDRVLKGGEIRAAFLREAVEAELRRREKRLEAKRTVRQPAKK